MVAGRAYGGGAFAHMEVTAIAANPNNFFRRRENDAFFQILQQLAVARLMAVFDF